MKIEIKKAAKSINFLRELFFISARNIFWTCLAIIFICAVYGIFLFYQYGVLPAKKDPGFLKDPSFINKENYDNILEEWQKKEEIFKQADLKEYPDPFRIRFSVPKEEQLTE